MKVIIAGGRDFAKYKLLCKVCDEKLAFYFDVEIISGTARGADSLGERYAREKGYKLQRIPANWDRYGKSAGYKRNAVMADYADMAIIFWDGRSKGTQHMIKLANRVGLIVVVQYYKKEES